MTKKQPNISGEVMKQIKSGDVRMRPATYFSFISILTILSGILAGLALAYASSVIFYWLRVIHSDSAAYGAKRNLYEALATFPWWVVVVSVILISFLAFFIKEYGSMYRHKLRHLVAIIVVISFVIGFSLSGLGVGDAHRDSTNGLRRGQNITGQ